MNPTEIFPNLVQSVVAVPNVCAWPNLTLLASGEILAIFHNQDGHGQAEGDVACWVSPSGVSWQKRSLVTQHLPQTVRMNHAAGVAANGDLVVLCSGLTNEKQPQRPKQAPFRDAVLRTWVMRSSDGGRSWAKRDDFPANRAGWTEFIPFGDLWLGDDGYLHGSAYEAEILGPNEPPRVRRCRSWHLLSMDDGQTWSLAAVIGPEHSETDLFPLGGPHWLAVARHGSTQLLRSEDNGLCWYDTGHATRTDEVNGQLNRLADGCLLWTYGVRIDGQRGVCARISSDDGRSWGAPIRLAHSSDGSDCGYPSSVQRPDGVIVTAWYSSDSPQYRGYHLGITLWTAPTP